MTSPLPERGAWMRCLLAVERDALRQAVAATADRCRIRYTAAPYSGLTMLRLREACLGDHVLLGELPLARVEVEVASDDGPVGRGAALAMVDDEDHATDLAVCDAVLAGGLPGHETIAGLVCRGAAACADEDRVRAGILHRTTVDFDLLERSDADDE